MRVLVVGDIHGSVPAMSYAIEFAVSRGITHILQVGDFGYYPKIPEYADFLDLVSLMCTKSGVSIFFIEGNHDDHWSLDHNKKRSAFVPVRDCLNWIPRSLRWSWCGVRFAALGGAFTTDSHRRKIGLDWHPDTEVPRVCDYDTLFDHTCDVLITHDAPHVVDLYRGHTYNQALAHSRLITELASTMQPSFLIHGHHHTKHITGIGKTTVVGLAHDKDIPNLCVVLELRDLGVTLVDL